MRFLSTAGRPAVTLALAATLFASTFGPAAPVGAGDPIIRDHRELGRLEVVVKKVHIFDDRDWGEGEIRIKVSISKLRECPEPEPGGQGFCLDAVANSLISFGADSGETIVLDRIVPGPGDAVADASIGPGIGFPVSAGPGYQLVIEGYESDTGRDDALGVLVGTLSEQNGWGPLGTYDERGTYCETGVFPPTFDCGIPAKYSVQYEIRHVPLPDLQPTAFRVAAEAPGDRDDLVCFTVQNRGPVPSEPFRVNLRVDGATPPSLDVGALGLPAGETREQCTGFRLPDSGSHQVTLVVGQERAVVEMDERNNSYEQILVRAGVSSPGPDPTSGTAKPDSGPGSGGTGSPVTNAAPAPGPSPAPAANQASGRPDLTVSTIRVRGQVPDGKKDCEDGKNDVTVVVKNAGTDKAGAFAVRLDVDGDEVGVETVDGLEAGKEREVRFKDVRLKKGDRELTASADATGSVDESDDEENDRSVTVRCQDD